MDIQIKKEYLMPTEAFYKLEPSKKEQLLASAIHEFSELPYEKVSIFKIAQNADVSRSGFYYYFKDKRDVYEYLINEIKQEFLRTYDVLSKPFDIFMLGESIFKFIADIKGTKREAFFRRVVSNTKADDLKILFSLKELPDHCGEIESILNDMQLESRDQLGGLVMFIATGIMYSLSGYLDDECDLETAENKLQQMFDIIKHGITKGV